MDWQKDMFPQPDSWAKARTVLQRDGGIIRNLLEVGHLTVAGK